MNDSVIALIIFATCFVYTLCMLLLNLFCTERIQDKRSKYKTKVNLVPQVNAPDCSTRDDYQERLEMRDKVEQQDSNDKDQSTLHSEKTQLSKTVSYISALNLTKSQSHISSQSKKFNELQEKTKNE